jgi:hypothetical protein
VLSFSDLAPVANSENSAGAACGKRLHASHLPNWRRSMTARDEAFEAWRRRAAEIDILDVA